MNHPRPPLKDKLIIIRSVTRALFRTLWGLMTRGTLKPSWSPGFEIAVMMYKGSYIPGMDLPRWRRAVESLFPVLTDGVKIRHMGSDQMHADRVQVKGTWYELRDPNDMVLFYIHGGGFVFGSLHTHGRLIGALSKAAGCRAFAPEYRLSPESPAPAAQEDTIAAYLHLLDEGIDPKKIVLVGDSAGGNLVISTLCTLRDRGLPMPAAGVPISPWVDLNCSDPSFEENKAFDYLNKVGSDMAAAAHLNSKPLSDPRYSPLFRELNDLPPLLIHAGDAELFRDQIRLFAEKAAAAGNEVTYKEYTDMIHVWHLFQDFTPQANKAIQEIGDFIKQFASDQ